MSFKDTGWTPIPNIIINNPAIPRCARVTYEAIASRAFGDKDTIFTSQATLARELGVSTRTLTRHLAVLEALDLIERIRVGQGATSVIRLPLKTQMAKGRNLSSAIASELVGLHALVLKREKLTMKEGLKLVSRKKRRQQEVSQVLRQVRQIAKTYRGE